MAATGLTRLSDKDTGEAAVGNITKSLYKEVLIRAAVKTLFPSIRTSVPTPMAQHVGARGILTDTVVNPNTKVAIAVLLRAGDIPANACRSRLIGLLKNGNVRTDYFGAARQTNEQHQVIGTRVSYEKAGDLDERILLLPDPMGATSGSVIQVLQQGYGDAVKKGSYAISLD